MCVRVCECACMHICVFIRAYMYVGLCVVGGRRTGSGTRLGVSAYMHACVCGESREPLFLPCSFSCVGGSEGIW